MENTIKSKKRYLMEGDEAISASQKSRLKKWAIGYSRHDTVISFTLICFMHYKYTLLLLYYHLQCKLGNGEK